MKLCFLSCGKLLHRPPELHVAACYRATCTLGRSQDTRGSLPHLMEIWNQACFAFFGVPTGDAKSTFRLNQEPSCWKMRCLKKVAKKSLKRILFFPFCGWKSYTQNVHQHQPCRKTAKHHPAGSCSWAQCQIEFSENGFRLASCQKRE